MAKYDFTELVNQVVNDLMGSIINVEDKEQVQLMGTIAAQCCALTLIHCGLLPEKYHLPD